MKKLQILTLLSVLFFSFSVWAQEKEIEKAKEKPAEKQKDNKLSDAFRKSNDPHDFIVLFWGHGKNHKTPLNPVPDVTDIELIFDETPNDDSNGFCFPDKLPGVEIITKSNNPNLDTLDFAYTVSGGRIIGKGENVIWDLSGVKPGIYTITAAVDDGCGFCGMTKTKTIVVKE